MDPNKGSFVEEETPETEPEVVPVCDRGAYTITNADKDEDE